MIHARESIPPETRSGFVAGRVPPGDFSGERRRTGLHGLDLWLVRHGATTWNLERRYCGWSDPPLDVRGEEQALALRPILAGMGFRGVWTSDLARARRTAALAWGPAAADGRLRELDFGRIEGLRWEDLSEDIRTDMADFDAFQAPGGESSAQLRERILGFLADLEPGAHLVFTHGGVIRALLRISGREEHVANGAHVRLAWPAASSPEGDDAGEVASARRETDGIDEEQE